MRFHRYWFDRNNFIGNVSPYILQLGMELILSIILLVLEIETHFDEPDMVLFTIRQFPT